MLQNCQRIERACQCQRCPAAAQCRSHANALRTSQQQRSSPRSSQIKSWLWESLLRTKPSQDDETADCEGGTNIVIIAMMMMMTTMLMIDDNDLTRYIFEFGNTDRTASQRNTRIQGEYINMPRSWETGSLFKVLYSCVLHICSSCLCKKDND